MAVFPYGTPWKTVRSFRREAADLARSSAVDVVWSTYMPGFPHLVAHQVSEELAIPWVADFRDLPDQTYNTWSTRRSVRYEVDVCASASAMVATSGALARRLETRHRAPVHVILNGFDPADYDSAPIPPGDTFTIRFSGTLYEFRDPRPLLSAIDLLYDRGQIDLGRVVVEFFGPPETLIRELATGFTCAPVVRARPRIPFRDMLRVQQESSVLLLLTSSVAGGAIPSKLFLYLGSRRPILNVPGDGGEVDAILSDTRGGVSAAGPEEIAGVLGRWYGEWQSSGTLECRSISERVERHQCRERAGRLARVLESVVRLV
jgi:glycosyltransferase involved in cell wall biosynthesis